MNQPTKPPEPGTMLTFVNQEQTVRIITSVPGPLTASATLFAYVYTRPTANHEWSDLTVCHLTEDYRHAR